MEPPSATTAFAVSLLAGLLTAVATFDIRFGVAAFALALLFWGGHGLLNKRPGLSGRRRPCGSASFGRGGQQSQSFGVASQDRRQ